MNTNKWHIIDSGAGVLTLQYNFKEGEDDATATTFAARMADGRMIVVSPAMGLTDEIAEELLTYGEVGAIVLNNGLHYMGCMEWHNRFPDARIFAPEAAAPRIRKKLIHLRHLESLNTLREIIGTDIGYSEAPRGKMGESWFWAKTNTGYAWYVSDILINLPALPEKFFPRMIFKITKSAPGYRLFNLMLMMTTKSKKETLKAFLADLEKHPASTIVPAHGDILSHNTVSEETKKMIQGFSG